MTIKDNIIHIFTDGACSHNPGKGGAAAILKYKEHSKVVLAYLPLTTNNQMELIATIIALKALKKSSTINIYTDSIYVKKGITEWIQLWKANGWRSSNKKLVKNVKLWQILLELANMHTINWHWVKGHAGHKENEEADQLAKSAIAEAAPLAKEFLFLSEELGYKP